VTFTNKAAHEMRDRVRSFLPAARTEGVNLFTFHAFGLRMLRSARKAFGLSATTSVIDDSDRDTMLRQVRADMAVTEKDLSQEEVDLFLMQVKGCGADPKEAAAPLGYRKAALLGETLSQYTRRLRLADALDFDDLILLPVTFLSKDEELRLRFAGRFDHIMVDEYQDTNLLQFRLLELLARDHRNLCVVGDDDQSIYGWRGARVENILEFDIRFPGARVVKLTRNYRSEANILKLANAVIARNRRRRAKELWTDAANEVPALRLAFDTQTEEAQQICDRVKELIHTGKTRAANIAVLYRTKGQSRYLQEAFRLAALPYRVVGSYDFFERKEVRDLLAYFKLACNPNDEASYRRVINTPTRGIGLVTLEKIESIRRKGMPCLAAAEALVESEAASLPSRTARALQGFVTLVRRAHKEVATCEGKELPPALARYIADSGMRDDLVVKGGSPLKAMHVLTGMVDRGLLAGHFSTLAGFLERVTLDQKEAEYGPGETKDDLVTLMTVHASKGLEFDAVFLAGLVDGLFPHFRSIQDEAGLEEERRLFYVALTRSRRHLQLSYFRQREDKGQLHPATPSRFLSELPQDLLHSRPGGKTGLIGKEDLIARFRKLGQPGE
ncbi:MAG: hypothetical protein FJ109_20770, partial [Deltaproteobacteria bacterium]|nr:hypothetical protein [Deltaproteobacteria bacterium]